MFDEMDLEEEKKQDDLMEQEYDNMPFYTRVEGEDGTMWSKDSDDLWNGGFGIRMNSKALVDRTRARRPEMKLKKGVTKSTPSLF